LLLTSVTIAIAAVVENVSTSSVCYAQTCEPGSEDSFIILNTLFTHRVDIHGGDLQDFHPRIDCC
jgi:hypothetical protein